MRVAEGGRMERLVKRIPKVEKSLFGNMTEKMRNVNGMDEKYDWNR